MGTNPTYQCLLGIRELIEISSVTLTGAYLGHKFLTVQSAA